MKIRQLLSTVVMSKKPKEGDFFPLMIVYQERLYSVGKIPGGFIKREGRPTENATLAARLIDRPIRPLFAEGFRNEVQVVDTILSVDQDISPEMAALFGSSLAITISDIPFDGPVAGVVVGRVDGSFVINPSVIELEKSDINLTVAGTKDAINMVESSSKEVSEDDMIDAIMFGHDAIKKLVEFQEEIQKEIGLAKLVVELAKIDELLEKEVKEFATKPMLEAIQVKEKLEKYAAIEAVKESAILHFEDKYKDNEELDKLITDVKKVVDDV
jgi:polyribonucleotide nucleotidyltransferase